MMDYNDLLDFEFDKIIELQIDILNSALLGLGELPIFENLDLIVDKDSAGTFFLRISLSNTMTTKIPLDLLLEGSGLRIDIYHLSESFEWSVDKITNERKSIEFFLRELFTSFILIESCQSINKKSQMYLFDNNGNLTSKHRLRGRINLFTEWNYEKKLFAPIYFSKLQSQIKT